MIFLEHSGLSKITCLLQSLDAPDRCFDSNLELISYSKSDNMFKEESDENLLKSSHHDVYSYFKLVLNKCFQDYDFTNLTDSYFKEVKNLDEVLNSIYYNISFIVGRQFPDFAEEFWHTIKEVVNIKDVDIYTFDSNGEDDPFNCESCINSFNYFMVDKKQQLILFVSCVIRTKSDSQDKNEYTPSFHSSIYSENMTGKMEEDCLSDIDVPETNSFYL